MNPIEQIEITIKDAKEAVDLAKSVERLSNNRDFKKVIQEGYFKQEAVRLVMLKTHPNTQDTESQKLLDRQIDSIGTLNQFLNTILWKGDMAARSIEEHEATREELLAEAAE